MTTVFKLILKRHYQHNYIYNHSGKYVKPMKACYGKKKFVKFVVEMVPSALGKGLRPHHAPS